MGKEFKGFYYHEMKALARSEAICYGLMAIATVLLVAAIILS